MRYVDKIEYYSLFKKNKVHNNVDESWKHAKWKKPDTINHILYDFIYTESMETGNKSSVCQGFGKGRISTANGYEFL